MPSGQELAQYYVQIIPSTEGIGSKIISDIGGDEVGQKAGKSIGSSIKSMIMKIGIGAAIASTIKDGLAKGGELQQAIGGVESLLGDSADKAKEYAQNAAATLQISAMDYMNQVTSFSAKLNQDLKGDTDAVVEAANMAIQSMSDNANKMGTDISLIQNAYQGFAKGNFTMLDNLKLGYGGTKTEMERLLKDAEAVKLANGEMVSYSIDNFADMVEAIQVMQDEMGIAGVSADEAKVTIQGSMNALSASWDNFVANMTLGEDIQPSLNVLYETVTNAANNLIPAVLNIVGTLPGAILDLVITLAPTLIQAGVQAIVSILTGLSNQMPELVPKMIEAVDMIVSTLIDNAPDLIIAAATLMITLATALINAIPTVVTKIPEIVGKIIKAFIDLGSKWSDAGRDLMLGLANGISNAVASVVQKAKEAASRVLNTVKNFFGIHSPSRVFAEIGEMNMLGLAEGIEDNMRPVTDAMDEISGAVTGSIESDIAVNAAAQTRSLGNSEIGSQMNSTNYGGVSINVYARENQSVKEIAEEVADLLYSQTLMDKAVYG